MSHAAEARPSAWRPLDAGRAAPKGPAPGIGAMTGYDQLIEGDDGAYMFTLRAGNHDTVVGSRVFCTRHSALHGAAALRVRSQLPEAFVRRAQDDGRHWFEVHDALGNMLARSALYGSRSGLQAGMASVQRNAVTTSFRGLVRHASVLQLAACTIASMITVHHLENSRSQRVLWLLEELALPYQVKRYARNAQTMLAPPELTRVHPLGKSPVITDSSADGEVTVAESGAIIEYLLDAHGDRSQSLRPPQGTPEQRRYTYWLHFAEGSAMPPLLLKLVFDKVRSAPVPFFIKPVVKGIAEKVTSSFIAPNLERQLNFMEAELSSRPWFAGSDFTAADIQMSFPLEAAKGRAGLDTSRPRLIDWLARIHARPAYQRALQTGGPYSMG